MARVTRDEARAFMLNRIEQIKQDNMPTNRIPFAVVWALAEHRGFLFSVDTYAFHLWRIFRFWVKLKMRRAKRVITCSHIFRFWVKLKMRRAKRVITCSHWWNAFMAAVETAQTMPIAKRVSERENLPLHQVIQGTLTQIEFLHERNVIVEPQALLQLYDKGTSIMQVNQFLRYAIRPDVSTDSVTEAFDKVFHDGTALTVTTCNAGEIHLTVPKLVRG